METAGMKVKQDSDMHDYASPCKSQLEVSPDFNNQESRILGSSSRWKRSNSLQGKRSYLTRKGIDDLLSKREKSSIWLGLGKSGRSVFWQTLKHDRCAFHAHDLMCIMCLAARLQLADGLATGGCLLCKIAEHMMNCLRTHRGATGLAAPYLGQTRQGWP